MKMKWQKMKAALIGGEYHGKAIDVPLAHSLLRIPRKIPDPTQLVVLVGDLVEWDLIPQPETYHLQATWIARDNGETLLTYTHDSTLAANYGDTMQRVAALALIVRHFGVVVGLNRWLDSELESRLAFDADLNRKLFIARVPFESQISEIEGRRNKDRLARRFPETFK